MCVPFSTICGLLPLVWIIAMPVVGAFDGPDTVLRLSLLMMLYTAMGSCVQKFVRFLLPIFDAAFFAVIVSLPVSVIPYPLVWMYGQLVWIAEPLTLLVEAVGIVRITMKLSRAVVRQIEDNPLLVKGLILGAAGVAYLGSAALAVYAYLSGSTFARGLLVLVVLVAVIHLILTIKMDNGIISDCAIVTLCTMGALCVGFYEANLIDNPLAEPIEWYNAATDQKSLTQMVLSLGTSSLSHVTKATRFLAKLISPALITMIVIRAVSMQQCVYWMYSILKERMLFAEDDAEDLIEEEDDLVEVEINDAWCPACLGTQDGVSLPTKLGLIFVYTQLVTRTMAFSGGRTPYRALLPARLDEALTDGPLRTIGVLRLAQIAIMALLYPAAVFHRAELDDEDVGERDW
ncbi:uncharacterized protein [Diadema antillarum]|uniref:uncharacterized protein n=1 Tax=Diadema antillarum TaxID=105358 RepID=UPI003A8B8D63